MHDNSPCHAGGLGTLQYIGDNAMIHANEQHRGVLLYSEKLTSTSDRLT